MSDLDDAMDEHMAFTVLSLGRPFSFKDFLRFEVGEKEHRMTHGTFRNKIFALKKAGVVELDYNSGIAFYTLKGHRFGKPVTPNHMVVSTSHNDPFYRMLQTLPLDRQSIHNIRLRLQVPNISKILSSPSSSSNPDLHLHRNKRSNDIVVPAFPKDGAIIQIKVHQTDVVSVIISCSLQPIALDFSGVIRFFTLLARTEERLLQTLLNASNEHIDCVIQIPDYKQWIITMWHFGRDSLVEYAGEKFSITVEDAQHAFLTRIYSKDFDNRGKRSRTRIRLETQQYPNTTVLDAIQDELSMLH